MGGLVVVFKLILDFQYITNLSFRVYLEVVLKYNKVQHRFQVHCTHRILLHVRSVLGSDLRVTGQTAGLAWGMRTRDGSA